MSVIAGPQPIRDPEKFSDYSTPAVISLITGLRLKTKVNIRFPEFTENPIVYRPASIAFAIRGSSEFVYVLFELHFKGERKHRFYKMAIASFQQCFDDYMDHQGSISAFSCVLSKNEGAANMRAQRLVEFMGNNSEQSAIEDIDTLALELYHIVVEPELNQVCRRKAWRNRKACL